VGIHDIFKFRKGSRYLKIFGTMVLVLYCEADGGGGGGGSGGGGGGGGGGISGGRRGGSICGCGGFLCLLKD